MYLQFHSVKEQRTVNIWVQVLFSYWQNLGFGSVRCCWVWVLSHLFSRPEACTARDPARFRFKVRRLNNSEGSSVCARLWTDAL